MDILTEKSNRVKAKVLAGQRIVDACNHAQKVVEMFSDNVSTGKCCADCFKLWHIAVK